MLRTGLLLLLFFLSGVAGLGYQVLWSKYLLQFIGVSAYSYATVLVVFMAGLALGSQYLGRVMDRVSCPLKVYCGLEVLIGAYAIFAFDPLLNAAGAIYRLAAAQLIASDTSLALILLIRCILALTLLLLPACLMGATFPAVLKYSVSSRDSVGNKASLLYALNALGAASGALLMGYLVIPSQGLAASMVLLGLLNFLLAAFAFVIAKWWPYAGSVSQVPSTEAPKQIPWIKLIFAAGFLSFVLEIAWTRLLVQILGSTTYSFSVVLCCFIFGIFTGSLLLNRLLARLNQSIAWFGASLTITGSIVLGTMWVYPWLPGLNKYLLTLLSYNEGAFFVAEFIKIAFCFVVMLPPTVFIGISIPLYLHLFATEHENLGQISGKVYAVNTWGNVMGAIAGSLFLMPFLGLEWTFLVCALIYICLGLFCLKDSSTTFFRPLLALATSCLILCLSLPWNPQLFTMLPSRRQDDFNLLEEIRKFMQERQVIYYEEDPAASVMVLKDDRGQNTQLLINGKVDATDSGDMLTQSLLAHVPLLLHPEPKEVVIVGYGSGVTAGSALSHPIQGLTILELIGKVLDTSRFFSTVNQSPLTDPRTTVLVEDAYSYLTTSPKPVDVIISEPSNPWIAGIASLFTKEFYGLAKQRLRTGGIFLQWLQAYEISDISVATIFRTFQSQFPYVYVFHGFRNDLFLIGSDQPVQPDWDKIAQRMKEPGIANNLALIACNSASELIHTQMMTPASVAYYSSLSPHINTRDNVWLEYRAPQELFLKLRPQLLYRLDDRLYSSPELMVSQTSWIQNDPKNHLNLFRSDMFLPRGNLHEQWIDALYSLYPEDDEIRDVHNDYLRPLTVHETEDLLAEYLATGRTELADSLMQNRYSSSLLQSRMSSASAEQWLMAFSYLNGRYGEKFPQVRLYFAALLINSNQTSQAADELVKLVHPLPQTLALNALRLCYLASHELFIEVIRVYLSSDDGRVRRYLDAMTPLLEPEMQKRARILLQ